MTERAIKLWFFSSLCWLALGPLIGAVMSLQFLWPNALSFLADLNLAYSKVHIFHTNLVIYGWIGMSFIAAIYYTQALRHRAEIPSARLLGRLAVESRRLVGFSPDLGGYRREPLALDPALRVRRSPIAR